jgi:NADH-quinone oxidoreductase subunit J
MSVSSWTSRRRSRRRVRTLGSLDAGAYVLFFALSATVIALSLMMLFSRNFVHSAAYLAGALLCFAGFYALLNATFLALLQVFIYAGAITVVVTFVVMMTRAGVDRFDQLLQPQSRFAAGIVVVFGAGLLSTLVGAASLFTGPASAPVDTKTLGTVLLARYAAPFELSSLILLAALIGAIYLAKERAS